MRKITKGTRNNSPVTDSNEKTNDNITGNTADKAVFPGTETPEEITVTNGDAVSDDTVTAGVPTIAESDGAADIEDKNEKTGENEKDEIFESGEKEENAVNSDDGEKSSDESAPNEAGGAENDTVSDDYEPENKMYTDTFDSEPAPKGNIIRKKNSGKKINIGRLIKTLATVAICVIIVIGLFNGASMIAGLFRGKIGADSQPEEIAMTSSGTLAYTRFQRGVLVANSGTVSYHNSKNDVVWEKAGYDGSPIIKGAGKYALVSYVGTPNALLFTGSDAVSVTGTGNIVSSCVNENGYFALVMTEDGYKNQIVAFDNNGNVIYRWHSAENYVTCVAISPDNKNMIASTIGFADNSFSGGVMIFDFAQEKPYAGQQESENVIMAINFVNPNRFVVIGDSGTSYYKTNGTKIKDIDYGGRKLTTFDVCDDGQTILCFAKDDSAMSNSDIYAYTSKGREKGHFETEGRALSISCCEGKVLVARENAYDLLNENCHWMRTIPVVKDIKNSVLFDRGRYSFVISGNTARVIRVD